ncbi:MAG: HNH endonuclease [SAR324 cluster bacterium]|nr:HNH endonuclease [SAR324 cluster bacterium]
MEESEIMDSMGDGSTINSVSSTEIPLSAMPYDRGLYKHWIDADGDCQNTRHEVLIEESQVDVEFKTDEQCIVSAGRWLDPYTGEIFTDPQELDVDHVVPLREAHISGAYLWDSKKKERYANDLDDAGHLVAVSLSANRSKGAKDPADWLPPYTSFHEEYARVWIRIKQRWELTFDDAEIAALEKILGMEGSVLIGSNL